MAFVAYFMPESPRWLVMKRRDEEAKQVLAALAGRDVSREDESIVQTYTNIRRAVKYEVHADGEFSYRELFTGGEPQNFRRICLCFGNQLMEEMCGINLNTYYMSNVFLQIGTSYFLSLLLSGVNSTTYFIASLCPSGSLIDMVGSLSDLWCSGVGSGNFTAGLFAILSIFLFNIFYTVGGWMATPFLYPSEISTLLMISPVAMSNIEYTTYIIFAALNFAFVFVIYFFYPETKGLALEQVDRIFIGGDPITRGAMRRRQITGDDFTAGPEEKPEQNEHVENVRKTPV
ncbi:Sugar transporter STL1 [Talaromyces pinophilus]|nr:Sugar transporter STL1 [Talaromyces pinophilus]